ncbi:sulfotransferase [Algivirga pacifica]|uniref:Sulfotransferase domain-containing protein n=1 Tax=Algivirga pacifica TaxID=1162670 RepID=A0ABP9D529_9BACT
MENGLILNNKKVNFFVVGAAKSGTTTLYQMLKKHPEVFLCPIKEPNFFSTEFKIEDCREDIQNNIKFDFDQYYLDTPLKEKHNACIDTLEQYEKLFKDVKDHKLIGDFSTSYLPSKTAPVEIYNYNKEAKIIIILRNPIARTISHYLMDNKGLEMDEDSIIGELKSDFKTKNKGYFKTNMYLDLSLYYAQVKRYLDIFPRNQILFLDFDQLKRNSNQVYESICNFLDIEATPSDSNEDEIHNQTYLYRNVLLKSIARILPSTFKSKLAFLKSFFMRPYKKQEISPKVKSYIDSVVGEDYIKVKELIK